MCVYARARASGFHSSLISTPAKKRKTLLSFTAAEVVVVQDSLQWIWVKRKTMFPG